MSGFQTFVDAKRVSEHLSVFKNFWLTFDQTKIQLEELSIVESEIVATRQKIEQVKMVYRKGMSVVMRINLQLNKSSVLILAIHVSLHDMNATTVCVY